MNMIDQARGWLARSLYRGLTRKGVAGPIIPEWVQHNFLEPTWRSIIREGYKANSAFFSCVSVWAFAFPEPRLKVYDESGASPKLIERHPLYTLLNRPADYLSQGELWQIAITYALVGGKAFLWKRRTVGGEVRQLIPYHAGQIQAQGKSDPWPTHYTYTNSEGRIKELGPEEVIYLRWMIDPDRPWDGMAPAVAAARDVDADTEAARYMYTLLKNDAIPRVALTLPPGVTLDDDQWARQQSQWQDRYGEGKRGMAAILEGGMDVKTLSLQMDQLAFDGLRRIPETRMCAACRVPAILAGVAAGLDRSTFSNVAESRLMFTQDALVPMWRYFAAEMTSGLRQDGLLGDNEALEFDTSQVNALAEAQAGKMDAFTNAVRARWVAPNEARAVIGLPPIEGGDVLQPEPQPMIQLPQAPGKRLLLSPGAVKAAGDIHTWYGFTDADLDEAEETFDEALPDVAGLLSAEVEDE